MLSSTGWVQSIVIFLVSFFFFKAAPLPLKVVLGFLGVVFAFLDKTSLVGAPGAFLSAGATAFFTVAAGVKGFLAGTGAFFSAGFCSATGFLSAVFLAAAGAFLAGSGSFLTVLAGSGFFSALAGSFLSFLTDLGASSAGRFVALALGSSLTFLGSSFLPLAAGAACCWPFLVCLTSGSLALGFSGSAFLPLGSALVALGFSLEGSALALALDGCCAAGFLPLSFLGAGALEHNYKHLNRKMININ